MFKMFKRVQTKKHWKKRDELFVIVVVVVSSIM